MKRELPLSLDIIILSISLVFSFVLWKISMSFPPDQIPLYIFMVGILSSFLLFSMVFGLSRAEKKAVEADVEHWRLFAALQSIPLGIAITDIHGEIVMFNDTFSKVLIGKNEEWSLKKLAHMFQSQLPLMDFYKTVLKERRTIPWTKVTTQEKTHEISLSPIFSERAGLLGALIIMR